MSKVGFVGYQFCFRHWKEGGHLVRMLQVKCGPSMSVGADGIFRKSAGSMRICMRWPMLGPVHMQVLFFVCLIGHIVDQLVLFRPPLACTSPSASWLKPVLCQSCFSLTPPPQTGRLWLALVAQATSTCVPTSAWALLVWVKLLSACITRRTCGRLL